MACGCEQIPVRTFTFFDDGIDCHVQPFRCTCQRDCYVGAPADYHACLEACDPECSFPEYPGLPSHGYRCDETTPEADACNADCDEPFTSAQGDCQETLDACVVGCTGAECDACYSAFCSCTGNAEAGLSDCLNDCDAAYAYPEAIACALAAISEDHVCCDTDLGDCYEPCESSYVGGMQPVEMAFLACKKTKDSEAFHSTALNPEQTTECYQPVVLGSNYNDCRRDRSTAKAPFDQTRRICRATCVKDEMIADRPEDRKEPECGGYLYLCAETCGANREADFAVCDRNFWTCDEGCGDSAACKINCNKAADHCYLAAGKLQGQCAFDCCKNDVHSNYGQQFAECRWGCKLIYFDSALDCKDAWRDCHHGCGSDLGCNESCATAYCTCLHTANDKQHDCRHECYVGLDEGVYDDCPDCFTFAASITEKSAQPSDYYSGEQPPGCEL